MTVILVTVFIDLIGFGIVIPVLPIYAEKFGARPLTIGLLVAVYSAMQFICAPLLGRLSDRVGRRPVLFVSLLGSAVGFTLMGAAHALWLLFVARIVDGMTGGNISTAQAYLADITPPEGRARAMGMIGAAFGLGFIFGPLIGGLMSAISLSAPFYFAAALAASNATLLYFRLPESLAREHRSQPHQRASVTELFRLGNGWVLGAILVTYFFTIAGFAVMTTLFPLFTKHRLGYDAIHTGYLFAYVGVIGATIQGGLIGRLVAWAGERPLATTGAAILAASFFALPETSGLGTLLVASAMIAVGNSLMTPTLNGLASRQVDASRQGRALGLMQSAGSLGRLLGPVLAGWLLTYDLGQPIQRYARTPLWVAGGIMVVAMTLTLLVWAAKVHRGPVLETDP